MTSLCAKMQLTSALWQELLEKWSCSFLCFSVSSLVAIHTWIYAYSPYTHEHTCTLSQDATYERFIAGSSWEWSRSFLSSSTNSLVASRSVLFSNAHGGLLPVCMHWYVNRKIRPICVCMYVCVYACVYVCVHVCMHVCMYVPSGSSARRWRLCFSLVRTVVCYMYVCIGM
jgi:hypothetical protein